MSEQVQNELLKAIKKRKINAELFSKAQKAALDWMEDILVPKFFKHIGDLHHQNYELKSKLTSFQKIVTKLETTLEEKKLEIETLKEELANVTGSEADTTTGASQISKNLFLSPVRKENVVPKTEHDTQTDQDEELTLVPDHTNNLMNLREFNDPLLEKMDHLRFMLHEVLENIEFTKQKIRKE